ncbi:MAG: DUF3784 domain-containing protein [Chloroflexi bacterium]|nr:DUF3784 domain-containing protein [Chloroflexota bacterium]
MSISEPVREPRETAGATAEPQSAANKLFDLRLLIGGLFVFYGLILIIAGAVASSKELHKAADININLWMGIGMFILGALFLLWRQAAPLRAQADPAPESMQPELPPDLQKETRARQEPQRARGARRGSFSSDGTQRDGRGKRS